MAQKQSFTVAAVYCGNEQRFTDSAEAENVTDAVIAIFKEMLESCPGEDLAICGVFAGNFDAQDSEMRCAGNRPKRKAASKASKKPFTVVTDVDIFQVMAANAVDAELDLEDSECLDVAAVFDGHLVDISETVDWDRVNAEVALLGDESDDEEQAEEAVA